MPVLTGEGLLLEPLDGKPTTVTARGLTVTERVGRHWYPRACVEATTVEVLITNARFVVVCRAGPRRVAASAASRDNVYVRQFRTYSESLEAAGTLAGHIRYPWLRLVGFKLPLGASSPSAIRLGVVAKTSNGSTRELLLDVELPVAADAEELARVTAARAARFRLAHAEIADNEERAYYAQLAGGLRLPSPSPAITRRTRCPGSHLSARRVIRQALSQRHESGPLRWPHLVARRADPSPLPCA